MTLLNLGYFKTTILVFLVASCFIFARCKKEHLHEYYFKCKVDGQSYEPDNCANCIAKDIIGDTVLILGGNRGFETLGIGINDNTGIKEKIYLLNEIIGRRGDYKFSTTPNDRYYTDSLRTGQLIISKLDKANKVIEGSFHFDAYNIVQDKIAKITDGKFRLQYKAY
jgi:hypothetical protein